MPNPRLLILLAAAIGLWLCDPTQALSVDPVASSELEQLIKNDFVISIRHLR